MDRELTVHIRLEGADELHQALDRIAIHAERVSERVRTLYRENPPDNIDRHDEFLEQTECEARDEAGDKCLRARSHRGLHIAAASHGASPTTVFPTTRMATYDGRLDQRAIDEGQMDAGLWPSHGGSQ